MNNTIFDFNIDPEDNLLFDVDSYKVSHWVQYPPNTKRVFSYIESRGGLYPETIFFGLQIYLKKYLSKPITQEMIDQAAVFYEQHGEPFNKEGFEYILKEHDGYYPVVIQAVPEGTLVPYKNAVVTIENTDENVPFITSWIETAIHRAVWYGMTVASNSWTSKQVIKKFMEVTADNEDMAGLDFMLHDFGARGVSSKESAGIGGAAHLVNFKGTDTVIGAIYAMKYYNSSEVPAFSIPAAEHSSITSWGKENEVEAYRNMLKQFGGKHPLIAVVSDSYDIFNACENLWGGELKQEVIDSGSTIVIRPDSGDPTEVVTKVVKILDSKFGSTFNDKGYKVLKHVKVIQGDGIDTETIASILRSLQAEGYSASNMAFGQGGALLQQLDRDTNEFAMKCSAALVGDKWIDVFKDPVTSKAKWSKKGRLMLYKNRYTGEIFTGPVTHGAEIAFEPMLKTVFLNGKIIKEYTFEEVRQNANDET